MLLVALIFGCRPAHIDKITDSDVSVPADTATDTATDTGLATSTDDTGAETGSSGDTALPSGTFDLVTPEAWAILEASVDPFADHRPADPYCDPSALNVDLELFEVDTTLCDYLSAGQGAQVALRAGETVSVLMYHGSLTWWEEASAHAAVAVGGEVIWEETIAIPAASEVYIADVVVPSDVAVGAPVVFHLHNHGSNTWNLGYLRVTR